MEDLPVRDGMAESVAVVSEGELRAAVPVGGPMETVIDLPDTLTAPVRAGEPIGTAEIRSGDRVLARCRLIAAGDVQKRDFSQSLRRLLRRWVLLLQP